MKSLQSQIEWYRRARLTLGVLLSLGAVLFYAVVYRPASVRLQTLRIQIESKECEVAQNQNETSNMQYLTREVGKLEAQVADYANKFPRQKDLGQFIREITPLSQKLSLVEWKYEPGALRRGDGCIELPILMHFGGDFLNVAAFLRQVENMQQLTRVKRIEVKGKDRLAGIVQVEMLMNIYFSED